MEGEGGDPPADEARVDTLTGGVDDAPALVAEAAGLGRELHPFRSRPGREVGGADAAAFEAHADLARPGDGDRRLLNLEPAWAREHDCPHGRRRCGWPFCELDGHGSGGQGVGGRPASGNSALGLVEPADGGPEAQLHRGGGLPPQDGRGLGDVGAAALRIVGRERLVDDA